MVQAFKQLFHVKHFTFESGRLVHALIGKDEEKEVHKSFKHALLPIQVGPPKLWLFIDEN
ncbi:MAG: hypothetical protein LBI95_02715 [Holosporales bacterium]|nr:hypothetical protein [Holosporales bacterium]